jgi:lipoyl(octanoyl) transferase
VSDLSAIPVAVAPEPPLIRRPGLVPYAPTLERMREFTLSRSEATRDELWLLEHPPVYTVGIAGKAEHWPRVDNGIPVLRIDRGGQITYHGPGQLVAYVLVDLRRRGYGIRELVTRMEQAVIDLLAAEGVAAARLAGAPGVYVDGAKIAALGLRVKHGCTYHGLAFNVDMDLAPFATINPCGYAGMAVTQCRDLGVNWSMPAAERALTDALQRAIYS